MDVITSEPGQNKPDTGDAHTVERVGVRNSEVGGPEEHSDESV